MEYSWTDESGAVPLDPKSVVLSCFPSAGLATTVAGHYMIRSLDLPRTGTLESPDGVPIAVIQRGRVHPAVRVYGRKDFALVLSEFPPLESASGGIARTILDGAEKRRARLVVCLEGVIPHPLVEDPEETQEDEMLWAASSRPDASMEKALKTAKARPLEEGVMGGVSGALLVGGLHRTIPVAVLLVSARVTEGYPDHRAGAALIEALDRLLPDLKIDTGPLRTQAELIEKALRAAMKGRAKGVPQALPPELPSTIYQ